MEIKEASHFPRSTLADPARGVNRSARLTVSGIRVVFGKRTVLAGRAQNRTRG